MSYYDRKHVAERVGDPLGSIKREVKMMQKLADVEQAAAWACRRTGDPERVRLASVVAQVAAMPEAQRAEFVSFCERLVGEMGNPAVKP